MKNRNHSRLFHVCTGILLLVLAMVMVMSTAMADGKCTRCTYNNAFHNGEVCTVCHYGKDDGKMHVIAASPATQLVGESKHTIMYDCTTCGSTMRFSVTENCNFTKNAHAGVDKDGKAAKVLVCNKCGFDADGKKHEIESTQNGYVYISSKQHGFNMSVCSCKQKLYESVGAHSNGSEDFHGGNICIVCRYSNTDQKIHEYSVESGMFYVTNAIHATTKYTCNNEDCKLVWYGGKQTHTKSEDFHNGEVCTVCKLETVGGVIKSHETTATESEGYYYVDGTYHATTKNTCSCGKVWYQGKAEHTFSKDFHNNELCSVCMKTSDKNHEVTSEEGKFFVDQTQHASVKYTCSCGAEWYSGVVKHTWNKSFHGGIVSEVCLYASSGSMAHKAEYVEGFYKNDEYTHATKHYTCVCGEEWDADFVSHTFNALYHAGDICKDCGFTKKDIKNTHATSYSTGLYYVNTEYHATKKFSCTLTDGSKCYDNLEKHAFTAFFHDGTVCQICERDKWGEEHKIVESVNPDGIPSVMCVTCNKIWTGSTPDVHKHTYNAKYHKGEVCMECFLDKENSKKHNIMEITDASGKQYTTCLDCGIFWDTLQSSDCKHVFADDYHNGKACKLCNEDASGVKHDEAIIKEMVYVDAQYHAAYQFKCSVCDYARNEQKALHVYDTNWHNGTVCTVCKKDATGTVHNELKSTGDMIYVDSVYHAKGKSVCQACNATWYTDKSVHSFRNDWHNANICSICRLDKDGVKHESGATNAYGYIDEKYHGVNQTKCTACDERWQTAKEQHIFSKSWHNGTICMVCHTDEKDQLHTWNSQNMCEICDIKLDENFTGLNRVDGYYYINGERCELTGLVSHNGVKCHIVNGKLNTETDGLTLFGDTFYFFDEGMVQNITDLVEYDGGKFFVVNGELADHVNGLQLIGETFYFLAQGQMQNHYGFALYDGEWFYLNGGKLDTKATGLYNYDGGTFLIAAGRLVKEHTGLAEVPGGDWYYVVEGQVRTDYTGHVSYNGSIFYVVNGKLEK